jgi:hypothetical protein
MNTKFENLVDNYYNGNLTDFRKELKKMSKSNLLRFAVFCATYAHLDIYEIEKQFNY